MNFKALNLIYLIASVAVMLAIWLNVGPFTAWLFAALACGLPQIVAALNKS